LRYPTRPAIRDALGYVSCAVGGYRFCVEVKGGKEGVFCFLTALEIITNLEFIFADAKSM